MEFESDILIEDVSLMRQLIALAAKNGLVELSAYVKVGTLDEKLSQIETSFTAQEAKAKEAEQYAGIEAHFRDKFEPKDEDKDEDKSDDN
tara:strand:- start:4553 stop:4822 length:270 start_codon:yes stop_codon:yes gene_type:complete